MTQTETVTTIAANGTIIDTFPAVNGWTVTAYTQPNALTSKLIAVRGDRKMTIHRDKVAVADIAKVAAEIVGSAPKAAAIPVDIAAQLMASIDAAKAKKAVA